MSLRRGSLLLLFAPFLHGCLDLLGIDFAAAKLEVPGADIGSGGGGSGGGGGGSAGSSGGGILGDPAVWAYSFGGRNIWDYATALVVDGAGNVYAAGRFGGVHTLDCAPDPPPNGDDLFVAKIEPSGRCAWMNVPGGALANALALDPDGNVVLAGAFQGGALDFGGGVLGYGGGEDIVLARLSSADGSHLGSWSYGGGWNEFASGLGVAPDGHIYLSGHYLGDAEIGSMALDGSSGTMDAFVAKIAPGGTPVWAKGFPGSGGEDGFSKLALTPGGAGVVVGGAYQGDITLDGVQLQGVPNDFDAVVARFDASDGAVQWARSFRGTAWEQVFGITVSGNRVLATGWFSGDMDAGNSFDLPSAGDRDVFLLDLGVAMGNTVHATRFGGPRDDGGFGVGVAPEGDVLLSGEFRETVQFADKTIVADGDQDMFVVRLPQSSIEWGVSAVWARRYGTPGTVAPPGEERAREVAVAPDGSVAVVGSFAGTTQFGATTLTSLGYNDAFVALLPP